MEKLQPILDKLKGVVDHVEKILLGAALLTVAFFCITKLLAAKKTIAETQEDASKGVTLRGTMYEVDTNLKTELGDLVAEASGNPKPLVLEGSNHMVFNPEDWKEVEVGTNKVLVRDSIKEPLGVSALHVVKITPVRLIVTPIAKLAFNKASVQYSFEQIDEYPHQFRKIGNIGTFFPEVILTRKTDVRLTRRANRGLVDLHTWQKQPARVINALPRDWIVKIDFKDCTPTPPGAFNLPQSFADNVLFDLDVIYTTPEGQTITNQCRKWKSKSPISIIRSYKADFRFQTRFHKPRDYKGYRAGRHLMMDGETLKILKVTSQEVHLWSDLEYGGNGKLYIKKLAAAAPVAVPGVPAPGAVAVPAPTPPGPSGGQQ